MENKLFVAEVNVISQAAIVAKDEMDARMIAESEDDEIIDDGIKTIWITEVKDIKDIPSDLMDWDTRGNEVTLCRAFFEQMMEEKRKKEAEAIRDKQQMKLNFEAEES